MLTKLFMQLAAAALIAGAAVSVWAFMWAGFVPCLMMAAMTLLTSVALMILAALNSFVEHKFAQAQAL